MVIYVQRPINLIQVRFSPHTILPTGFYKISWIKLGQLDIRLKTNKLGVRIVCAATCRSIVMEFIREVMTLDLLNAKL